MITNLFVGLIRASIGSGRFTHTPSSEEWVALYKLSERQAIVGITYCGIQKLYEEYPELCANLPFGLKIQWGGMAASIQSRNNIVNQRCRELRKRLKTDGFDSCILKGQGVAALYGSDLSSLRQSGDIDVWVDAPRENVIGYVAGIAPPKKFDQKHIDFRLFEDVDVEAHWIPVKRNSPKLDKILRPYFERERKRQMANDGFPTADFQLMHQLLHVYGHYVYDGLGLRQMMDLYFAQRACLKDCPDLIPEILDVFKQLGLMKFIGATQWVLMEVFGEEKLPLICEPEAKGGKKLLSEIEIGGDLGQYDLRNQVKSEIVMQRFCRRLNRKLKMWQYDPVGSLMMPWQRLKLEIWMRNTRRKLRI